jgi:chromosomal replication initiation ATPase DnaA
MSQQTDINTATEIIKITATAFGVKPADITGPSRVGNLPLARHMAIKAIYGKTAFGQFEIAQIFGKKVVSSISKAISAAKRAEELNRMMNEVLNSTNR